MMKDTYLLEGDGTVVKAMSMLQGRVNCHLVRAWKTLVYAIGGRSDGHLERYDVEDNKWHSICRHPEPMSLSQTHAVNIYERFIYVIPI